MKHVQLLERVNKQTVLFAVICLSVMRNN